MTGDEQRELRWQISSLLDKTATTPEVERLEAQLCASVQARRYFLEIVDLEARLARGNVSGSNVSSSNSDRHGSSHTISPATAASQLAKRRTKRFGLAIAVSLLGILLCLTLWPKRTTGDVATMQPIIWRIAGEVQIQTPRHPWRAAVLGQTLAAGVNLRTPAESDELVLRYPDGTTIVLLGEAQVQVVSSPAGGKELRLQSGTLEADVASQPHDRPLWIVTPHARFKILGTQFALATEEGNGTRLDLQTGRVELLRGADAPIIVEPNSIATVPPTAAPVNITARPTAILQPVRQLEFPRLKSLAFADQGQTIVATTNRQAVFWGEDDHLEAVSFAPAEDAVKFLCRAGDCIALEHSEPRHLLFWNIKTQQQMAKVENLDASGLLDHSASQGEQALRLAALSPRGDWMVTRAATGIRVREFCLYDLLQNRVVARPEVAAKISNFAASPDGKLLAVAHSDINNHQRNWIELLSPLSGERLARLPFHKPHLKLSLGFSGDSHRLVIGMPGLVQVWNLREAVPVATFNDIGFVIRVALSRDGESIAAATSDGQVRVWNISNPERGMLFAPGRRIEELAFSPDGRRLAVLNSQQRITVWNVAEDE